MKLADNIVIDYNDHTISIDGEVFPYYVANDPKPTVKLGRGGEVSELSITILADKIEVRR